MNNPAQAAPAASASTPPSSSTLIPVFEGRIGDQSALLCDARELHRYLGVGKDFSTWIADRIKKYEFAENQDYMIDSPNLGNQSGRGGDRRSKDYHLTLDTAKELAMVENTEQGRQARRYFIECERKVLAQATMPPCPSPTTILSRDLPGTRLLPVYLSDRPVLIADMEGVPWVMARTLAEGVGMLWGSQERRLIRYKDRYQMRYASGLGDRPREAVMLLPLARVRDYLESIERERLSESSAARLDEYTRRAPVELERAWMAYQEGHIQDAPASVVPIEEPTEAKTHRDSVPQPVQSTNLEVGVTTFPVVFSEAVIHLVEYQRKPWVLMRSLVDALGLTWDGQRRDRMRTKAEIYRICLLPDLHEGWIIPVSQVTKYLISIHQKRINAVSRGRMPIFIRDCERTLAAAWKTRGTDVGDQIPLSLLAPAVSGTVVAHVPETLHGGIPSAEIGALLQATMAMTQAVTHLAARLAGGRA